MLDVDKNENSEKGSNLSYLHDTFERHIPHYWRGYFHGDRATAHACGKHLARACTAIRHTEGMRI